MADTNFLKGKILIISLTQSGSQAYAQEMCKKLSFLDPRMLFARKTIVQLDQDYDTIQVLNRSKLAFAIQTLFFVLACPFIVLKYKSKGIRYFYFTVFHTWNLIFALWGRLFGITNVLTIHDFKTHRGEKSYLIEMVQYLTALLVKKLIFLSDHEKDKALQKSRRLRHKSRVLRHPLLTTGYTNSLAHSRDIKLLFLGRMVSYKGADRLIDLCQRRLWSLTVAGRGILKGQQQTKTVRIINRWLDDEEVRDLILTHHILVLPYTEASQSGVMMLGLSTQMVMAISRVGGLPEYADEDTVIWFDDISELEEQIEELMTHPERYQRFQMNVHEFVGKYRQSWQKELHETLDWITS